MDPVLDPLLGRLTIKKGRYIKIGDKEVEYHPKFRLILQVRKSEENNILRKRGRERVKKGAQN